MQGDISEKYRLAKEAYKSGHYEIALRRFSRLITFLVRNGNTDLDIAKCIRTAINTYKKMGNDEVVNHAAKLFDSNLIDQYYYIIRHYFDHRTENDARTVEEKINKKIPTSEPEETDFYSEEGPSTVENEKVGIYQASIASAQGPRETMEDTYLIEELVIIVGEAHTLDLFGVFDGHGGIECAEYVRDNLSKVLNNELEKLETLKDISLYNTITKTFVFLNDLWGQAPLHQGSGLNNSGTTATVAIVIDHKTLWVANVGDSRTVLARDGMAIQLSEDAKPTQDKYYYEILQRGGDVRWGRVDGSLDMARSIGDLHHPSVSARPTIRKFFLEKDKEELLIIACDGLWSVVDPKTAAEAATGKSAQEAAKTLKELAYTRGSWDNVTVMVVDLSG